MVNDKKKLILIFGIICLFLLVSISALDYISNAHNQPDGGGFTGNVWMLGVEVTTRTSGVTSYVVEKLPLSTATTCYMYYTNETLIATGTYSGNNCTITLGTARPIGAYYFLNWNGGNNFNARVTPSNMTLPLTSTSIYWNSTSDNAANFSLPSTNRFLEIANIWTGISPSPPISVTLNSPINDTQIATSFTTYNATLTQQTFSLTNATFFIWFNNGTLFTQLTNTTFDTTNFSTYNISLPTTQTYLWNVLGVQGNGNGTNSSFAINNFTIRYNLVITNKNFVNATNYETATDYYIVNITTNGTAPINALLIYNNSIVKTATITSFGNTYNLSAFIEIPVGVSNNSFYFNMTIGGLYTTSDTTYQSVYDTTLTIKANTTCPPGYLSYLNFSFADEGNSSTLNAVNALSDVTYFLGLGSITKSLTTSNSSANPYYLFCLTPQNKTLTSSITFKYSANGYPLRTFVYTNQTFTNATTNKTLYLLSTSDGIYSSISVVNTAGAPLDGTVIVVERQFNGVWTIISQDTTGSDGVATFWVNPNFQHRFTATKSGYQTSQVTITPSQSLYTLTLASTAGDAGYTSPISGLLWTVQPKTGTIEPGAYNFNATINSSEANLEGCRLEIVNASNISQILNSATASATNTSYCFVNVGYTLVANVNVFGRLSVDTTESSGYVIVNADWKWITIDIERKAWRSITSFFDDLTHIGEFGEGNKGEFSRIVTFFILSTLVIGLLIYFTGIELTSPGASIIIIWILILIASAGGFLTFNSGSSHVSAVIEKWGFAFVFTIFVINYFLTTLRRSQEE